MSSRRSNPAAKPVASSMLSPQSLYGLSTANEELRELRHQLDEERGKKKAARLMIEQLQLLVNERDKQVEGLTAQLMSSEAHLAHAAAEAAEERARAAHSQQQLEAQLQAQQQQAQQQAAQQAQLQATLPPPAAAAPAAATATSPSALAPLGSGESSGMSLMRARGLEAENGQLRSVAITLQNQRDAFEAVARQLQGHAIAVETAFGSLQAEAFAVLSYSQAQDEALKRAKRSQTGYESGLSQLLLLLAKQQEKVKR
jgi:hypothetical protein